MGSPVVFRLKDFYVPTQKQRDFHESSAKYKCFMGGVGSGKTMALVMEGLLLSLEMPNNYGLIGRYTYPELRDTTMFEFFNVLDGVESKLRELYGSNHPRIIKQYIKTEHKLTLVNNSTIIFRHLEEPDKLKSLNLGWFGIDEGTETPEDVFLMLQSRLRKREVPRRVGFVCTNPEGHDWVYGKFGIQHRGDPDYLLITVSSRENPYLPEGYVDDLIKSYPEHWVRRYIDGDPRAFAGQIISNFDERVHVVDPFEVPNDWVRTCVLDHGTNNPTAVLWVATNSEGFHFVYREHYESGKVIDYHANKIITLTGSENVDTWIADPAIFNKTLQDPRRGLYSVAEAYAEHGLHFIQGDNDVKAGINKLVEAFAVWDHLINPVTEEKGSPKIFIFKDCENTIWEIPQYKWKTIRIRGRVRNKPEEPEKSNDHTVDDLRYFLMADVRPRKSKIDRFSVPFVSRNERILQMLETRSKMHARRHRIGGSF